MNSEALSYSQTVGKNGESVGKTFVVERKHFLAIGAIFLVSRLALLWYNEAEFTDAYEFIQWSLFQPAKRHPFYPLLIKAISSMMDPIIAGRLISSIAGLLCLPSLIKLSRRLYGPMAALMCCLLFTVSPQILFMNTRVLSESLFLAVTLAAITYFMSTMDASSGSGPPARASSNAGQRPALHFFLMVLFSGLAASTRPEGLILAPMILMAAVSLIRRGLWKNVMYALPGVVSWILYFLWARYQSNLGYQSELAFSYTSGTPTKFLTYLFAYIDVYPYTAFLPVFALAFLGVFRPADAQRRVWLLTVLYIHVAIFAAITVHQAWSTRFLLLPVTLILVEAAGTLQEIARKISARAWNTVAFSIVICSLIFAAVALYYQRETYADIKDSALYIRSNAKEDRVFSDEIIKTTYYAGRSVNSYRPEASYSPGDIIVLHSFHIPLVSEFKRIAQHHELEFLFSSKSKITPMLANTLLDRQRTNLPIALTERFRVQKFYSAVARVRSVRPNLN